MASLDTPITVKVSFEGTTRRTKMPLRDMVPGVLENNLRTFLDVPSDAETVFERYSDSAACFVQLTPGNIPVYKQLYRAAKAKSKLKIRATFRESVSQTKPQPASPEVEAEPPSSSATIHTPTDDKSQETSQVIKEEANPSPFATAQVPAPAPMLYTTTTLPDRTLLDEQLADASIESQDPPVRPTRHPFRPNGAAPAPRRQHYFNMDLGRWDEMKANSPSVTTAIPTVSCPATGANFAVCCNNCEENIPDFHYHCSTCDDGDFDLCMVCAGRGFTCHDPRHWMIKRNIVNGALIKSTTHILPSKPKSCLEKEALDKEESKEELEEEPEDVVTKEVVMEDTELPKEATKEEPMEEPNEEAKTEAKAQALEMPALPKPTFEPLLTRWATLGNMRTCNCCVQELPEQEFVHCTTCEDYDLCQPCFAKGTHGHHPKHGFKPAVEGTVLPENITVKMKPGRNQLHHAICDGCDKYIHGVRHKCLDCPDWDYCSDCIQNSNLVHVGHRFVPIYEQLSGVRVQAPPAIHAGICCDGPLCSEDPYPSYIRGVRYKCAVCHDFDLCANCEASPTNNHNKTHPMIKFRTPVRHVSVTTIGEHPNGKKLPTMGDRPSMIAVDLARANSMNQVQTVVDVKPTEPILAKEEVPSPKPEEKQEVKQMEPIRKPYNEKDLHATFQRDTIVDGTILPPNHVFEQTWTLRNEGKVAWPAGCSVKFVGGDYMGHVDSNHPAGISELVSASESTVCYAPLAPGQDFPFTVLLRTPSRPGRIISYWRLTTPDGYKFGHRLWCDINVRLVKESEIRASPRPVEKTEEAEIQEETEETGDTKAIEDSAASSQMVFPKLDKESPVASVHMEPEPTIPEPEAKAEEESDSMDEWDPSDDGFMTDEEYDILDASDEEYLQEQKKMVGRK